MRPIPRCLTSWKPWFYQAALPALRQLGPARCDAALGALGRVLAAHPGRAKRIDRRLTIAREALGADWDLDACRSALAANLARFAARDCTLEGLDDQEALSRFDASGVEHLDTALAEGRGAILLGGHFGAYLAALHWLVRRRVPLRAMLQRPRHVSAELSRWFDLAGTADDPHRPGPGPGPGTGPGPLRALLPQPGFFLRRTMPPGEGVLRVLRSRAALRAGLAVYLNGDVAWDSGCSRPGQLLGLRANYQAAWADLAALTGAPVLPILCVHRPGGRFGLTIDPPWTLRRGDQQAAVDRYLARLESAISSEPAEAIAHLLWPPSLGPEPSDRPRRAVGSRGGRWLMADG
ncbi:lysophospholipid acyltransferase family protein [Tautonia sociabilis]|uniref:Lipid A biosynthesis acyltransferase n=1 Tax=Tautonia sociabilis TaxID=2080755 RepID=A0A432MC41_9BACT|nr:hypothetical protein [Tautonia sociabilis]RUL81586.1 hypothetical protein TsocGM_24965 [Tautonia sociabilis]